MSWVVITTLSEKYWDDGPREIYGPFETVEDARQWASSVDLGQEPCFWELASPENEPKRDVIRL